LATFKVLTINFILSEGLMISISPKVIIGCGTSGAKIIDKLQQRMYSVFGKNTLDIFKFISIETDWRYVPEGTPMGTNTYLIKIESGGGPGFENLSDLLNRITQIRGGSQPDWIDPELAQNLRAMGEGAGNVRVAGRLLFWSKMQDIYDAIQTALQEITTQTAINQSTNDLRRILGGQQFLIHDDSPMAIICGTATGGTFSGSFIDLGYLCQEALGIPEPQYHRVYGYLLLPPKDLKNKPYILRSNAYGALVEWDYLAKENPHFREQWPIQNGRIDRRCPPYGYIFLVSQEYNSHPVQISSLEGLYQLVAFKIFLDLMGVESKRAAEIINIVAQENQQEARLREGTSDKFTFGLAAIDYPKYQIAEYVSCLAGADLCNRWLDKEIYIDPDGKRFSVPNPEDLFNLVRNQWENSNTKGKGGILPRIISELSGSSDESESMHEKIKGHIKELTEGNSQNLSKSLKKGGDTFYGNFKRELKNIEQKILVEIKEQIYERLDITQNLAYTASIVNAYRNIIASTLNHWNNMEIPKDDSGWNMKVNEYIKSIEHAAKSITNKPFLYELLYGMITDILEELKLFILREPLQEVEKKLSTIVKTELKNYRLMLEDAKKILLKRAEKIITNLNDESLPIIYVYTKGNFDDEIKALRIKNPGAEDIAGEEYNPYPPNSSKWIIAKLQEGYRDAFINERGEPFGKRFSESLKRDYMKVVFQQMENVQLSQDCLKLVKQYNYIERYFGKVKYGNLKYKFLSPSGPENIFTNLYGKREHANKLLQDFREKIDEHFNDDNILYLPGTENSLIYLREDMIPSKESLENFDLLKEAYERLDFEDETKRRFWQERRIAYNVLELQERAYQEVLKEKMKEMVQFINDVFIVWKQVGNTWQPISVRDECELNLTIGMNKNGEQVIKWGVLPREGMVEESYIISDSRGEPIEEEIDRLVQEPEFRRKVLNDFAAEIKRLGYKKLEELWNSNDPSSPKKIMEIRIGSKPTSERFLEFFGSGESQSNGLIRDILKDKWL